MSSLTECKSRQEFSDIFTVELHSTSNDLHIRTSRSLGMTVNVVGTNEHNNYYVLFEASNFERVSTSL
jgi:hypothetical protein